MATEFEMALLSYMAYQPSQANKIPLGDWIPDDELERDSSSNNYGFAASVYTKGAEVVVAFRGTDNPKIQDFYFGNIPAARGTYSDQVSEAIKLVADTMEAHPGKTLSFTGHSLGGGLAALMAVYFDKEAKVFDTAPFGLSAQNKFVPIVQVAPGSFVPIPVPVPTLTISEYFSEYQARQLSLGNGRTVSAAFGSYANVLATEDAATRDALFALRAQNVTAKYLEGEVLVGLRALFPNIVSAGGDPPMVPIGTTTMNDSPADLAVAGMSLHSMRLLAAMLASPDLRTASGEIPTLLEAILDDDIYSSDDKTDKVAFLNRLLADQVAGGSVTPGRAVDDFAADVRKLTGTAGLVQTNVQARNALIVAAMDYYYLKDLSQTTALFTVANGGIHFSYSDIGSGQTKSRPLLRAVIESTLAPEWGTDKEFYSSYVLSKDAWHIQGGEGPLNWTAGSAATDDVVIGGASADIVDAGSGADFVLGGDGNDNITGGAGDDQLFGGQGTDTYSFSAGFGSDVILDADGNGSLVYDGNALSGGLKAADASWLSDPAAPGPQFRFTLVATDGGNSLIITRIGTADRITVRRWQAGQLGISLQGTPYPITPPVSTLTGDFGKLLESDEETYVFDGRGNYEADTQLPLGPQQDSISGDAFANVISGGALNDVLSGLGGDDEIYGGDGDDYIAGGLGRDSIEGGAGNDYIYGSGAGVINRPQTVNDPPPAIGFGVEWARGFGWVIFGNVGSYYSVDGMSVDTLSSDSANFIDGGTGNDFIRAGSGDDTVHGGLDDDAISGLAGSDTLSGDDGHDHIRGDGSRDSTKFEYVAPSQHGRDLIDGGIGNDVLIGQGNDDTLFGGLGNDDLFGDDVAGATAAEDDTPVSVHGRDALYGGEGNDYLEGGGSDDTLRGGTGNDVLIGDAARDGRSGAIRGNDELDGGDGADQLFGGALADTLVGGAGNDILVGDGTVDNVVGADHGNDALFGDGGDDQLFGGGGSDVLYGGSDNDILNGDDGDTPAEVQGDDYLDGGDGTDILSGGGGADTLFGGSGDDTLYGDGSNTPSEIQGDDYLDGGEGSDVLLGAGGADTLFGRDGSDQLHGDAADVAPELQLGDYLDGGAGSDWLKGYGGDDRLFGGDGGDLLNGDEGADTLVGDGELASQIRTRV